MKIEDLVHERGPMTVAAFMDLALYHPEFGYYARAAQRSGRAGDFFTSVDVGPLFGQLLAVQIEEMAAILAAIPSPSAQPRSLSAHSASSARFASFDLIEAGAGNGRLTADILRALRQRAPDLYSRLRVHLVESSATARAVQRDEVREVSDRLTSSSDVLPDSFEGVLIANELLDAMPVHQVVMREDGLREIYVTAVDERPSTDDFRLSTDDARLPTDDCRLTTVEGPPSTPLLVDFLARARAEIEPGWRVEINLRAVEWIRDVAKRLRRGFVILIDYGHLSRELYSISHSTGTLTSFSRHTMDRGTSGEKDSARPAWLHAPGEQDLTAHVDFSSVRAAGEAEGLEMLGLVDQTYFLLGLVDPSSSPGLDERLALKTLTMPGGLGSTHKVLIFGKGVGAPSLRGCAFSRRMT